MIPQMEALAKGQIACFVVKIRVQEQQKRMKITRNAALLMAFALGLTLLVAGVTVVATRAIEGPGMSWLGLVALAGGVLGTVGLGVGLMRLSYLSARSGHDEQVGQFRPTDRGH